MKHIQKIITSELFVLLFFVFLFIAIRSLYYKNVFVFIYDQVSSSTKALELWKTKSITFIGPPMSLTVENRQIFFGGISYYIQLLFLLIGRFDPFWSTYAFMVFAGIMSIPLYYGMKKLVNKNAAVIMVTLYALLPFFIESTFTLWNPYFMFSLLPILVFCMGLFKTKKSLLSFMAISLLNGILFQLHYMYIFVWIGMVIYYFVMTKMSWKYCFIFLIGFACGTLNLIVFELRHNFYLLQTMWIFLTHAKKVSEHWFADYYLLSELFFAIIIVLAIFKKRLNVYFITLLFTILLILSVPYVTIQAGARNYPKDWYYKDELTIYQIIKSNLNAIHDFNIFEFYVATGTLPKYFLKKDNVQINFDDYYHNKYLYVVYKNDQFMKDPAYEVATFSPSKTIKVWKINKVYNLYLLERL